MIKIMLYKVRKKPSFYPLKFGKNQKFIYSAIILHSVGKFDLNTICCI